MGFLQVLRSFTGSSTEDPKDLVNVVVKRLDEELSPVGFGRKGKTWARRYREVVQVINLQSSQWNTKKEARFTINVALVVPEEYERENGKPMPKIPKEEYGQFRVRLGYIAKDGSVLKSQGKDLWWRVRTFAEAERVSKDVVERVTTRALPFLQRPIDIQKISRLQ